MLKLFYPNLLLILSQKEKCLKMLKNVKKCFLFKENNILLDNNIIFAREIIKI